MSERFAIYAVPGALRDLGRRWFARPDVQPVTVAPRRYGFHATLKAPFPLAPGHALADVLDRLELFAASRAPVVIPDLTLASIEGFFALIPGGAAPALADLAAAVVVDFDDLRGPADLARHRPERLDPHGRALLERYGYPHVLDRWQCHLTLTDGGAPAAVEPVLRAHFAPVLGRDITLESVSLFVEPGPGEPFAEHSSFELRG